jgi:hypothetical protein
MIVIVKLQYVWKIVPFRTGIAILAAPDAFRPSAMRPCWAKPGIPLRDPQDCVMPVRTGMRDFFLMALKKKARRGVRPDRRPFTTLFRIM